MDIKTAIIFEAKKNERVFQFIVPAGAPLGECYDVAHEFLIEITNEAKKATDAAKKEDKATEVKAEVVEKK